MPVMSDFLQTSFRTHMYRAGTFAKPGAGGVARFVSLHTGDPAGTGANEVTGGSYVRTQKDASDTNWSAVLTTDGVTKNQGAVTWAAAPTAPWGLITHWGFWDAVTGGNFLHSGPLLIARSVNAADPAPSFPTDSLVATFGLTGQISDYLQTNFRMHIYRAGTFAKSTARWVSLHTADPVGTGVSEVTGGSYVRIQRDAADANWNDDTGSTTSGITRNVAAISWSVAPTALWGNPCTHFGVWDASTAGNFLHGGLLTPTKVITSTDPAPSFAALAMTITFS
jgi:hypothetical protein